MRASRRLGNPGQQGQGVGGLAPVDQDPGQGLRRLLMARLELERLAQGSLVARGHQRVRLAEAGSSFWTKAVTWGSGRAPMNWSTTLPSRDGEDGRDGLHPEGLGDPRVVVHIDFGQLNGTISGGHGPFEHGAERRAGPAPGGPEVDDDRNLGAAGQYICLKGVVGNIHRSSDDRPATVGVAPAQRALGRAAAVPGRLASGSRVRPARRHRVDNVTKWFVDHVPEITTPLTFTLIAGGRSNLTFRVEDADGRAWVLRRPPSTTCCPRRTTWCASTAS